jgi:hypothetical protein
MKEAMNWDKSKPVAKKLIKRFELVFGGFNRYLQMMNHLSNVA